MGRRTGTAHTLLTKHKQLPNSNPQKQLTTDGPYELVFAAEGLPADGAWRAPFEFLSEAQRIQVRVRRLDVNVCVACGLAWWAWSHGASVVRVCLIPPTQPHTTIPVGDLEPDDRDREAQGPQDAPRRGGGHRAGAGPGGRGPAAVRGLYV